MEKPIPDIDFNAAFSFLTEWSDHPATYAPDTCSLELPVAAPNENRLRYICVGLLYNLGPLKFYKTCQFSNGECPLGQYTLPKKVNYEPLEIETKWAKIKAKGG